MVKHFCDICGKEINMKINGVSVSFRADNIHLLNDINEDKHLCIDCTSKVKEFIRNSAENRK